MPGPPGWTTRGRRSYNGGPSVAIHPDHPVARNVLGTELQDCSHDPITGFYRDGCCRTGAEDRGIHVVCARVTAEFLEFSKRVGNDLSTPRPAMAFPGLEPGDRWCLCAARWTQALDADAAPPVVLEATHMSALEFADLDDLKAHAWREEGPPPERSYGS